MVRTSYNLIREGKTDREIRNVLLERYKIANCRWRQDAIIQGDAANESQKQVMEYNITKYTQKVSNASKKLEIVEKEIKRQGLQAKIEKYQEKIAALRRQLKDNSYPRAVFGTKKLLRQIRKARLGNDRQRYDDLISEWKKRRSEQFLAVGQADNKGNRNVRIGKSDNQFYFELRNWVSKERLQFPLRVPEYCRMMIDQAIAQGERCEIPYTVRVIKVEHGYQIHITVERDEIRTEQWNGKNIAGIDLNPEGIGVTIVSPSGNLIKTRFFKESRLVTASANKRNNILGELVKGILNWIKKTNGCNLLVLESLKFKGAYDSNSNNNRVLSNFAKSKMVQAVKSRAIKEQIIVAEVDPKYSSKIALEKYSKQFQGFQRHELAAFIIARRALGYSEIPSLNYFEDRLKQIVQKKRKNNEDRKLLFMWNYCQSTDYGYRPLSQMLYRNPTEWKSGAVANGNQRIVTKLVIPRPAKTPSNSKGAVMELSHVNGKLGASVQVGETPRETELEGTSGNPSVSTSLIQSASRNVKRILGKEKLAY